MTPPLSADGPTATTSGVEFTPATLRRWRERFRDRLEVTRDLPWRHTRDPWAIYVAEAMLQQTQVARVIPAWNAFLADWPTPRVCAQASRADVIRRWEGLGYHRRAVALHAAAQVMVEVHQGAVPATLNELLALPGVGPYSARAILAFAFEQDVAVVDTNVARVLSRAVAGRPMTTKETQALADAVMSPGRGWAQNQALLDLGAEHCTARPSCAECVLRRSCSWARSGFRDADPARKTAGTSRPQSRFRGSDRELRGRLLAAARQEQTRREWEPELESIFGAERITKCLDALVAEGLLATRGDEVVLA